MEALRAAPWPAQSSTKSRSVAASAAHGRRRLPPPPDVGLIADLGPGSRRRRCPGQANPLLLRGQRPALKRGGAREWPACFEARRGGGGGGRTVGREQITHTGGDRASRLARRQSYRTGIAIRRPAVGSSREDPPSRASDGIAGLDSFSAVECSLVWFQRVVRSLALCPPSYRWVGSQLVTGQKTRCTMSLTGSHSV